MHEPSKLISDRIQLALDKENCRKYAKNISVLFVSGDSFESKYIFSGEAVCPNSSEYSFLLENISPKIFVLEFAPQSLDRSWKLNDAKINNIKKFSNLMKCISSKSIPTLAIVIDKYFDMAYRSGILDGFDLVLLSSEKSAYRKERNFQSVANLDFEVMESSLSEFILHNRALLEDVIP